MTDKVIGHLRTNLFCFLVCLTLVFKIITPRVSRGEVQVECILEKTDPPPNFSKLFIRSDEFLPPEF